MSEAPSWLTSSNAAAPAASPMMIDSGVTSSPAPAATSPTGAAADGADLPGVILFMRLGNMGVAILLIVVSVLKILTLPLPSAIVLAVYAIIGGVLICCLETQLRFLRVLIAVNFGFLFNSIWRFLYYILLAAMALSFDSILGWISAGCLLAAAIFNTYVLCRYPSYRKIREQIAEEEDKRIEARISKEVRKQVANQISK